MTTETLVVDQHEQELTAEELEVVKLMEDITDAEDPKKSMVGRVFTDDEDGPDRAPPAQVRSVSGGFAYLWRTDTGEKLIVDKTLAPIHLRKKHAADHPKSAMRGKRVFTPTDPGIPQQIGDIKCMLHVDHPDMPKWESMGFTPCPKATIPNEFQLRSHMQHRHNVEWSAMELDRSEIEKQEERDFQRSLISGSQNAGVVTAVDEAAELVSTTCEVKDCNAVLLAKSKSALGSKLKAHNRKAH